MCQALELLRQEDIVTDPKIVIWLTSQREEVVGFLTPIPTRNTEGKGQGYLSRVYPQKAESPGCGPYRASQGGVRTTVSSDA